MSARTREELLTQFEELAGRLNIESLKKEDPSTFSGYCRIRDHHMMIRIPWYFWTSFGGQS